MALASVFTYPPSSRLASFSHFPGAKANSCAVPFFPTKVCSLSDHQLVVPPPPNSQHVFLPPPYSVLTFSETRVPFCLRTLSLLYLAAPKKPALLKLSLIHGTFSILISLFSFGRTRGGFFHDPSLADLIPLPRLSFSFPSLCSVNNPLVVISFFLKTWLAPPTLHLPPFVFPTPFACAVLSSCFAKLL